MRNLNIKIVLFLLALSLVCSAESVLDEKLSFTLPSGFQQLSSAVIKTKFPNGNPPKSAYGNASTTVTVAINSRAVKLSVEELPKFKDAMKANIQNVHPDVKFEEDSIVTLNGQKWAHLIFVSQALDGPIRNEMLFGPKAGTIYMVNLNATTKDYPSYSKALGTLKSSLKIN